MWRWIRTMGMAGLVPGAVACGDLTGPSQAGRLAEAVARWEAAAFAAYEVELIRGCYCGWPDAGYRVALRVVGTEVTEAWYTDSDLPIEGAALESLPTVPALFAMIAGAINEEAHRLRVTYDPAHGAPASISIDYIRNAVDDEVGITVFRVRDFIID